MGILARLRLAEILTMARPNSPDMLPKRTKKVRLGISCANILTLQGSQKKTKKKQSPNLLKKNSFVDQLK